MYPEDRARFHVFAKTGTFVQRLKQSAGGMLHGYFRSRSVDGTYMWLHHVVFCVPRSNFEQVLYATAETGTDLDSSGASWQTSWEVRAKMRVLTIPALCPRSPITHLGGA